MTEMVIAIGQILEKSQLLRECCLLLLPVFGSMEPSDLSQIRCNMSPKGEETGAPGTGIVFVFIRSCCPLGKLRS